MCASYHAELLDHWRSSHNRKAKEVFDDESWSDMWIAAENLGNTPCSTPCNGVFTDLHGVQREINWLMHFGQEMDSNGQTCGVFKSGSMTELLLSKIIAG